MAALRSPTNFPSLPEELLQLIVDDDGLSQPDFLALTLTSRTLHRMAVPLLYEDPSAKDLETSRHLHHVLRNNIALASLVRTFRVRHLEFDIWRHYSANATISRRGTVTVVSDPSFAALALPNCKHMLIKATRNGNYELGTVTFVDCLQWASRRPLLTQLSISWLFAASDGLEIPAISLPPSLHTLHLHFPMSNSASFGHKLFWTLCKKWVQHLQIDPDGGCQLLTRRIPITFLRELPVPRLYTTFAELRFNDRLFASFHSLEELEAPLQFLTWSPTPTPVFPRLRVFTGSLWNHIDAIPDALRALSDALHARRFPSFRRLVLQHVTGFGAQEYDGEWYQRQMEYLTRLMFEDVSLPAICKELGVDFFLRYEGFKGLPFPNLTVWN